MTMIGELLSPGQKYRANELAKSRLDELKLEPESPKPESIDMTYQSVDVPIFEAPNEEAQPAQPEAIELASADDATIDALVHEINIDDASESAYDVPMSRNRTNRNRSARIDYPSKPKSKSGAKNRLVDDWLEADSADKHEMEPVDEHSLQMGAQALNEMLAEKKRTDALVSTNVTEDFKATTEKVSAEVNDETPPVATPKLSRKEFDEQQNEAFGLNDPQAKKDYEAYLESRPVAKPGDFTHYNGRVYTASPIGNLANKKEIYEGKLADSNADDYYEEEREVYEKVHMDETVNAALDEALVMNEAKTKMFTETLSKNVEGEVLVQRNPGLRGLLALGEELLTMHENGVTGKKLAEKRAMYDDLYASYLQREDIDDRALGYIGTKTVARIDNPDFTPLEGTAYSNGEKIDILDFSQNPDGTQKAYVIERADGTIEAVYPEDVEFKPDYDPYEAEKLSRFERAKKWFGEKAKKVQEYHGLTYMGYVFGNTLGKAGEWLTSRHIDEETMTADEIQKQKEKNRRNNLLGGTALFVAAAIAAKVGYDLTMSPGEHLSTAVDANSMDMGGSSTSLEGVPSPEIGTADGTAGLNGVDLLPQAPITPEVPTTSIFDTAYVIPQGGTLTGLFSALNLEPSVMSDNAQTLASQFPADFYRQGDDVRLMHAGWLSPQARAFIETLR